MIGVLCFCGFLLEYNKFLSSLVKLEDFIQLKLKSVWLMQNVRGMRKVPFAISHWYIVYLEINMPFNIHCEGLYSKFPQVQQSVGARGGTVLFHIPLASKMKLEKICPLLFKTYRWGSFFYYYFFLSTSMPRKLSSIFQEPLLYFTRQPVIWYLPIAFLAS